MDNTHKFGRFDPRNLDKAMEKAENNDEKGTEDTETPKAPIEDETIAVTKEMLNEMIASVVATHMKTTEAEKRQARETKEKQMIRLDGEEEAQVAQQKQKERVKALLEQLQGKMKRMKGRTNTEGPGSPKGTPLSWKFSKQYCPRGFAD